MRALPLLALALLAAVPLADARMVTTPRELDLRAGEAAAFRVQLYNDGRAPLTFSIDPDGDGLLVDLDPTEATIPPRSSVTLAGTVRALPWTAGERVVRLTLHEDGHDGPVETQEIRVHVAPLLPPHAASLALAAGATGLAGATLGLAWARRWHLVALALYARLRRERLDEHPARATILRLARERPGLTLAEAQQAAGLPNGPFEHHVRKLVQGGRLVIDAQGRARHLRLPDSPPTPADGTEHAILAHVRERRAARAADVARTLGLSRQALHYHVRKLAKDGHLDARLEAGRLVLADPRPKKGF